MRNSKGRLLLAVAFGALLVAWCLHLTGGVASPPALSGADVALERTPGEVAQEPVGDGSLALPVQAALGARRLTTATEGPPPEDSLWVEGVVIYPPGTPQDEELELIARGRRFDTRGGTREFRSSVGDAGRFRVAFSSKTRLGTLSLVGRYLYLPGRKSIRPAKSAEGVALEPLLGGVLRVTFKRPETAEDSIFEGAMATLTWRAPDGNVIETADVNDDGVVEWTGLSAERVYVLGSRSEQFTVERLPDVVVQAGRVTEIEMEAHTGVSLRGRVVDERARPISGARVYLTSENPSGPREKGWYVEKEASTNAAGEFALRNLRPGKLTLVVQVAGKAELREMLGVRSDGEQLLELEYTLRPGKEIRGKVRWPDGRAARGVTVEARAYENNGRRDWTARRYVVQTSAAGAFKITGLDERLLVVTATVAGFKSAGGTITQGEEAGVLGYAEGVQPGARDLELVLGSGGVVRGTVMGPDGPFDRPFSVTLTPDFNRRGLLEFGDRTKQRFSKTAGEFVLSGLRPGAWQISVAGNGLQSRKGIQVEIGTDCRVSFDARGESSVAGVVRSRRGELLPLAKVHIRRLDGDKSEPNSGPVTGWTNAKGDFLANGLAPGRYALSAELEGWVRSDDLEITLSLGEQHRGAVLILQQESRVEGRILPSVGHVQNRSIHVSGGRYGARSNASSDAQGLFVIHGLGEGHYTATLAPVDGEVPAGELIRATPRTLEFDLTAGGTANLVFKPEPLRPIEIRGVVKVGVVPLAGCRLEVRSGTTRRFAVVHTDDTGSYHLTVDGPGDYTVRALPAEIGGWSSRMDFRVAAREERICRLDLELPRRTLTVTLLSAEGFPVAGGEVALEVLGVPGFRWHKTADAQGRAVFAFLTPGSYVATIPRGGALSPRVEVVITAEDGDVACVVEYGE